MRVDLAPWQRKLVEANSRLQSVAAQIERYISFISSTDWAWTWEQIMTAYRLASKLYAIGAEESRRRAGVKHEEVETK